ncbi:MAG TPA: PDZ domain-containing protein [Chthoniobacterales bacterium]|nr:PDZ domain-containing protein [Chthoniobacterales bacterium]
MIAVLGLLPIAAFAQAPVSPVPPVPPVPPVSPSQTIPPYKEKDKDKDRPKVPVTYLGVETSSVPRVVSEQLGLPKGFGLVVDYVVPDGPAAAAGVQQNDIIKMLNDQILMEPDQLAKLVRSYQDGTNVTLTILRKNAETKVTVKLGKKEVRQRDNDFGMFNMEDFNEKMKDFNEKMKDFHVNVNQENIGPDIRETVRTAQREAAQARAEARQRAREEVQRVREQAQRTREEAQRQREEAQRHREEAQRSSREMRVFSSDKGALKSTTIDLGKATIVFSDDKGELKLETVAGKKILTVKDPQGRLLFSGPVDTKEEVDKMPPEVRQRYEMLDQSQLPNVPSLSADRDDHDNDDNDRDDDSDDDDNDNDKDTDSVDVTQVSLEKVSCGSAPQLARNINLISI